MQKRRSQRLPCHLEMTWQRHGATVATVVKDINEHGFFMLTDQVAQPGELLRVVVQLPSGPVNACVTARYSGESRSGRGIGADLFLLSETDRDRWAAFYTQTQKSVLASAVQLDAYDFEEITETYLR